MKRIIHSWPPTPNFVKRLLRDVLLIASRVEVTWVRHKSGLIRFHVELANKYRIIPIKELRERIEAAFRYPTTARMARYQKKHVSLWFTLDMSRWI